MTDRMQYAISVLQSGITALEQAGVNDHRIEALKDCITFLRCSTITELEKTEKPVTSIGTLLRD